MAKATDNVIDNYYKFLNDRVQGLADHLKEVQRVSKKAVDPTTDPKSLVGEMIGLGFSCYDVAFGWMYPLAKPNGSVAKEDEDTEE
jgi:hypothetical protein